MFSANIFNVVADPTQSVTREQMNLTTLPISVSQSYLCTATDVIMVTSDVNVTLGRTQWEAFNVPKEGFNNGKMLQ